MISSTPTIRRRTNRRSLRSRDGLIKYAHNHTSQNGEDGIIARLFNVLLPPLPPTSMQRYCVDVGAWDGVHLSNTYTLLVGNSPADDHGGDRAKKWSGVLIEANSQRFQELRKLHDPLDNICLCEEVSYESTSSRSLVSILKRDAPHLPQDFDFLSIDIDGMDYWLLVDLLGSEFRPKVICIEFNPTMPIDLVYVQPCDDNIRHGSSLSALVELANAAEYTLVETTLFNAFFVQKELYELYLVKEVPDTSIETLHEVTMGTELYQLYDGTIHLWGCKKLLWHRIPIDEEKIQILSPEERSFPFAPLVADSSSTASIEGRKTQKQSRTRNAYQNNECDQRKFDRIREMAVDMSSYCDALATMDQKRDCYTKLIKTLHHDGFALVRGFDIPERLCKDAICAARSFLHEADESVRRSCLTTDRARRGYSPMSTENFASLIGEHGPNDLVKKYRIGPPQFNEAEFETLHPMSSLHEPNVWPSAEVWGEESATNFKSTIEEYFDRICYAADCILRAICDGITNDSEIVNMAESIKVLSGSYTAKNDARSGEKSKNHTSILTLLGYQLGSRHKKGSKAYMRPLVSAHTDVGVITLLLFDNGRCAALERAATTSNTDRENIEWLDVNLPPLSNDPVFVVNVGDCLSDLNGGMLRSTLHRVMPRTYPHREVALDEVARTCLALFVGLEPSANLTLPSGEVLTYEGWRRQRISRAQAVMKSNTKH